MHFTSWHQEVWKPVITAVNGICCGGGFHWVADADIVIAASDAQFFDPHVSVGQVVAIEAIGLMKKMPVEAVMRMAFMGKYERMGPERAYELGMICEIVDPPEQLRERAQEIGETIAKNSPAAMAATKKALWGALELGLTDACKAGAGHLVSHVGSPRPGRGSAGVRREARPGVAAARSTTDPGRMADRPICLAAVDIRSTHAVRRRRAAAVSPDDRSWTAGEARAEVTARAHELAAAGVGPRRGRGRHRRWRCEHRDRHDGRDLAARRVVRPGQRSASGRGGRCARSTQTDAGRRAGSRRGRAPDRPTAVHDAGRRVRALHLGTTGPTQGDRAPPRRPTSRSSIGSSVRSAALPRPVEGDRRPT